MSKGDAYRADTQDQGHANQGNPNQGYPNQGYPNQAYPNQGYPMQGYGNTNVVVTQPVANVVVTSRPNDYFVFAILTCLFCFWPTGIIALVFSCNSRSASDRMDFVQAQNDGNLAKIFSIVSLVIGLVWIIAVIIYVIVISVAVASAISNSNRYYTN